MKVYLVGGSDDGLLIDDAPEPNNTIRRYFRDGDRQWSELYAYADLRPELVDGRRSMHHMPSADRDEGQLSAIAQRGFGAEPPVGEG